MHFITALILFIASTANAATVDLKFSGNMGSMRYSTCEDYAVAGYCNAWSYSKITTSTAVDDLFFASNSPFAGEFKYQTSSPLSGMSSDGFQAVYLDSVTTQNLTLNSINLPESGFPSASLGSISIVNGRYGADIFYVSTVLSGTTWSAVIGLFLNDSTGNAFNLFEIPNTLNYNDFTNASYSVAFVNNINGDQLTLDGKITEFSVLVVSEPESAYFMAVGLFILAVSMRQNKRKS